MREHAVCEGVAAGGASAILGPERRWLWALCLSVLLVQVDTSVVNLAVRAIGIAFRSPVATVKWVVAAYNLTYAALLLSGGTLADLLGRRRIVLWGIGFFTAGCGVAALASSIEVLIMGRIVSGIGAALILPATLALIRVLWPEPTRRAHAIGIWAGMSGAAFVIGPPLGGLLVAVMGWRGIFLLTVPLGLIAAWLTRVLPESSAPAGRHLDLAGQAWAVCALAAFTYATTALSHALAAGLFGIMASLGWYLAERRAGAAAMVPLAFLRRGALLSAMGVAGAMTFGMYGLLFLVPLVWQRFGVLTVGGAGFALLPMSVAFVALSHKSGRLSARFGAKALISSGMGLIAMGLAVVSLSRVGAPLALAETGLTLAGFGMAFATGPNLALASGAVAPERSGTASALANTARMWGATLGVAAGATIYGAGGADPASFTWALRMGALVVAAGAILALRGSDGAS